MKYYQIVFSPTGGTERVARAITQNWSQIDTIDLCTPDTNYSDISFDKNSLVLIAMPSLQTLQERLTKANAYPVCDVCPFVRFTPEKSVLL